MTKRRLLRFLGLTAIALTAAAAVSRQTARADDEPAPIVEAPADAGLDDADIHLDDGIYRLDGASEAGLAKQNADSGCAVGSPAPGSHPPVTMIGLTAIALLLMRRRRRGRG